jgi:predicted AAA+ superfamily ATPase
VEIGQQTTEAVGENREALAEKLARIRRDEDLSEHAKGRLTDEARRRAAERHAEIVDAHKQNVADVLESNEKRLLRLEFPEDTLTPSQKQAFRDSYRDASFRVMNMGEDDLSRILTRAERIGDRALAQAVYHKSVERGIFSVSEEYRDKHPDAHTVLEIYQKSRIAEESHGAALMGAVLSAANPSFRASEGWG